MAPHFPSTQKFLLLRTKNAPARTFFFYLFFIYYGGQAVFFPTTFLMFIVFPFFFQGPSSYFISALSIPS